MESHGTMIRELKGLSLNDSLLYISNREKTVNRIAVNVFRNVLSPADKNINVSHYIKEGNVKVNRETLVKMKDGIFEIRSDRRNLKKNKEDFLKENDIFVKNNENEEGKIASMKAFEKICATVQHNAFYARDIEISPNGRVLLETSWSTIAPKVDSDIIAGVNTSMWYVGGPGSATALHVEDGDLPSMNILICGESKFWGFINPNDYEKVSILLGEYLSKPDCILFHKPGFMIDPQLLNTWKVDIQFLEQRPGDLVYVGEGILHMVVNNGLNLAEAINFGTRNCLRNEARTTCKCRNMGRMTRDKITREKEEKPIIQSKKRQYECSFGNCEAKFLYKSEFNQHVIAYHKQLPISCREDSCNDRFQTRFLMKRHYDKCHKEFNKKLCPKGCGKLISNNSMYRHVLNMHTRRVRVTCNNCNREMLYHKLIEHLKHCKGPATCNKCQKVFITWQGLSQHAKTCQKITITH